MAFLSVPLPVWREKKQLLLLPCNVKIHICGGKGEGLYSNILGCNPMSLGRDQSFLSLWSAPPWGLLVNHPLTQVPMFFVQKAPVVQKHENIHGALFPYKSRDNKNSSKYGLKLEWDYTEMKIRSKGKQGQARKEMKSVCTSFSF